MPDTPVTVCPHGCNTSTCPCLACEAEQGGELAATACSCPAEWWASGEAIHTPGCPCAPDNYRETPLHGWSLDPVEPVSNASYPSEGEK